MKPKRKATVIGGSRPTVTVSAPPSTRSELNALNRAAESQELQVAVPVNTGAIVLAPEQYPELERELAALNFAAITSQEVILLGNEAQVALGKTLDDFMASLDKEGNARLFELLGEVQDGVKEADLPKVLNAVLTGRVGWKSKLSGLLGRKTEKQIKEAFEDVKAFVTQTSVTLQSRISPVEDELAREMQSLLVRLEKFDDLKEKYREHFVQFAFAAGLTRAFLDKATAHVEQERIRLAGIRPTATEATDFKELEHKLDLLKSRALALEGRYTGLPAEHALVQRLQSVGLATLQEVAITAADRFTSIKATLAALSGEMAVKELQMTADRSKSTDESLQNVRNALLKDIATTAAHAPGDNRLAQAKQIEGMIAAAKEFDTIVAGARKVNDTKFDEARKSFATSRAALAELSPSK